MKLCLQFLALIILKIGMIKVAVSNWNSKESVMKLLGLNKIMFFALCKKGQFCNKEKSCVVSGLRAQQNQDGDNDIYRTVTVYLFLAKTRCLDSKLPKVYRGFSTSLRTLNDNQLLSVQQNKEGNSDIPFTVAVYLFLAKSITSVFIFTWFFTTYVIFSSSKKRGATLTYIQ